jgi:uncharacterized SAM-binding protein YcdF (DUF218 family)
MAFIASKVLWILTQPGNFLVLLLIAGVALQQWAGRSSLQCLGRRLTLLVAAAFLALAVLPLGNWLILPLESRFPAREPPPHVDGIVMLGGAVMPWLSSPHGQPALNDAAERVTAFMELARRYPDARMVFTGGSGFLFDQEDKEATIVCEMMARQGFDLSRFVFESESRNTFENAVFTQDLVKPRPGETWLLVTSAQHMPRSVGIFRKTGWPVVPYPVDYRTPPYLTLEPGFSLSFGLMYVGDAVREWIGLVAYWLMGRTDALFPGPT